MWKFLGALVALGLLFVIAALVWGTPRAYAASWYNASWGFRFAITIDHTKVGSGSEDESNFPVLISLTGLSHINAGGSDVRFTSSDGTTELPREIESYSSGTLVAWVKVPTVSHSSDTVIYMYYGNAAATEPAANSTYGSQNVWTNGYAGVWHLSDNAANTTVAESTANGNSGANVANTSAKTTAGKIGGGLSYNGSSDDTNFGKNTSLDMGTGNYTLSGWVKTGSATRQGILNKYFTSDIGIALDILSTGPVRFFAVQTTGSNAVVVNGNASVIDNAWHYVTGVRTGVTTGVLYIDGTQDATQSTGIGNANVTTASANLYSSGTDGGYSDWMSGNLDELHIANVARSAGWVSTEYKNQSSPSTFYSVNTEETAPLAAAPARPSMVEMWGGFFRQQGGQVRINVHLPATNVVFLTSGTSWTVPANWNNNYNTIEVIGGGGQAAQSGRGGGGGGGYSKITNVSLTPGASITYAVGAGGTGGSATVGGTGGDTWFNAASLAACVTAGSTVCVGAKGGAGGLQSSNALGGQSSGGVGTVTFSGGTGLSTNAWGGGGGGGAAGPGGAGANGAAGAGSSSPSCAGGAGGTADNGGGGSGGTASTNATNINGGNGGNGTEWDATHGAGGGGGGGCWNGTTGGAGGTGGNYGGGSGSPGDTRTTPNGTEGIIVITWRIF